MKKMEVESKEKAGTYQNSVKVVTKLLYRVIQIPVQALVSHEVG